MSLCKCCNREISEENTPIVSRVYYDPEYPDIEIGPYCISCVGEMYICTHCHKPFHEDDAGFMDGSTTVCKTCYQQCDHCEDCHIPIDPEDVGEVARRKLCRGCASNYKKCKVCERERGLGFFKIGTRRKLEYPTLDSKGMCILCFDGATRDHVRYEVRICEACSSSYSFLKGKAHEKYCKRCQDNLPSCSLCGKIHHQCEGYTTEGSGVRLICRVCVRKHKRNFCSCGKYTENPIAVTGRFSTKHVCSDCVGKEECPQCLEFRHLDNGLCLTCNKYYREHTCERCGRVKDSNGNCRVCDRTVVYNYTHRPRIQFNYTHRDEKESNPIFFGVENELTFSSQLTKESSLKHLYQRYSPSIVVAKSDSSIRDPGFEVVTQPMTLSFFHKMDLFPLLPKAIYKDKTCGMHVHIGRVAFSSDLHLHRVVEFIHDYTLHVDAVAGRGANYYNGATPNKSSTFVLGSKKNRRNFTRNLRVNLNNARTVEFRLFAGCTTEFEMRYRLEWLHALVSWLRYAPESERSPNFLSDFIKDNIEEYSNIDKFLKVLEKRGRV